MKLAHYVNPPPRLLRFDLFSVLFWRTWHGSGFSLLLRVKKNSLNMKHWNICWTINWRVLHCWIYILCRKGAADPHQKQVLGRSWSRRFIFSKEVGSFLNFFFIYGVNLQAQQSQPHLQRRGCTAINPGHHARSHVCTFMNMEKTIMLPEVELRMEFINPELMIMTAPVLTGAQQRSDWSIRASRQWWSNFNLGKAGLLQALSTSFSSQF